MSERLQAAVAHALPWVSGFSKVLLRCNFLTSGGTKCRSPRLTLLWSLLLDTPLAAGRMSRQACRVLCGPSFRGRSSPGRCRLLPETISAAPYAFTFIVFRDFKAFRVH